MGDDGGQGEGAGSRGRPTGAATAAQVQKRFAEVWARHREEVFRACLTWTGGSPSEAEDALSVAALRALRDFDRVRRPRSWLLRVAHNVCMDSHRDRARRGEQSLFDDEGRVMDDLDLSMFNVSRVQTPENQVLSKELERYLLRCIEDLPDRLRLPLRRKVERYSYRRISSELGISDANARKRIQQAREILRRRLAEYSSYRGPALAAAADPSPAGRLLDLETPLPPIRCLWQVSLRLPGRSARDVILCLRHPAEDVASRARIAWLERYVAEHPRGWKLRLRLARSLRMNGDIRRSVLHYQAVLVRNPVQLDAWLELISSFALLQRFSDMFEAFEAALRQFRDPVASSTLRAWVAARRGSVGEAEEAFTTALQHSRGPSTSALLIERGRMRYAARNWRCAARDFEHCLDRHRGDPVARVLAHDARCRLGDLKAAQRHVMHPEVIAAPGLPAVLRRIYHRCVGHHPAARPSQETLEEIRGLRAIAPDCFEPVLCELLFHHVRGDWTEVRRVLDAMRTRFSDHEGLAFVRDVPSDSTSGGTEGLRITPSTNPRPAIDARLFLPSLAFFE